MMAAVVEKMVTLAVHTQKRAEILCRVLEKNGIKVSVEELGLASEAKVYVRLLVREADLPEALNVAEALMSETAQESKRPIVLVPIDFSEYSVKACEVAFHYASRHKARVVILHSYVARYFSGTLGETLRKENPLLDHLKKKKKLVQAKMNDFESFIAQKVKGGSLPEVECRCVVMEGIPENAILEYSRRIHPVLIVMGTRGKHQKEQDLIGSVTAEVLDSVKYPMFVVPESISVTDIEKIDNVLFFSNLEQSDLESLDLFMQSMESHRKRSISVVHVVNRREKMIQERMDAIVGYCKKSYVATEFKMCLFSENAFMSEFERYLLENKVGIVVIPNKKRNIFSRLFNPSIAHRILFHTDIPMWVVPTA